jgi:hypothetical protein
MCTVNSGLSHEVVRLGRSIASVNDKDCRHKLLSGHRKGIAGPRGKRKTDVTAWLCNDEKRDDAFEDGALDLFRTTAPMKVSFQRCP